MEVIMHNLISYNQLATWNHLDNLDKTINEYIEQTEQINDYYQCLIECSDNQAQCKRICKEILSS